MHLPLTIPPSLHKKLALYAKREGVDIDTFVSAAVAEHLGRTAPTATITVTWLTPNGLVTKKAKRAAKKPGRKAKK